MQRGRTERAMMRVRSASGSFVFVFVFHVATGLELGVWRRAAFDCVLDPILSDPYILV
jgi:hypothetical protein